ncbi:hypothetical protein OK016_12230 [Vibrio chagasii]|nr:hypothetical protein [Vibrio chagasii]
MLSLHAQTQDHWLLEQQAAGHQGIAASVWGSDYDQWWDNATTLQITDVYPASTLNIEARAGLLAVAVECLMASAYESA